MKFLCLGNGLLHLIRRKNYLTTQRYIICVSDLALSEVALTAWSGSCEVTQIFVHDMIDKNENFSLVFKTHCFFLSFAGLISRTLRNVWFRFKRPA